MTSTLIRLIKVLQLILLIFVVNNLLDKEPEYTSDAGTAPGNGNTFPGYFDAFGQYVFLNLALKY